MKKMYKFILAFITITVIAACTKTGPVPFKIGKDACDYCKMMIMSNKHGFELINSKGKIYKFDDISCGAAYVKAHTEDGNTLYAVDYTNGNFLEVSTGFYLKSDKIKTPMNSNIIGFSQKKDADKMLKTKGGEILTWDVVKNLF